VDESSGVEHVEHFLLQTFDENVAMIGATPLVNDHHHAQAAGGDIF
jgi:hypothetical protein